MTVIYALRQLGSPEVRYIGRTNKPLDQRLRKHLQNAARAYPPKISAWLRQTDEVEIVPLVECADEEAARAERSAVQRYHALGDRLTNSHLMPRTATNGALSATALSPVVAQARSAAA